MIEATLSTLIKKSSAPKGEQMFDTAGTFQWVCPEDVTEVCCVLVAPGQSGQWHFTLQRSFGGDGGGLRYRNAIPVVPGTSYPIVVTSPAQTAVDDNELPCTAFGISVQAGPRGTPIGGNIFGGVGGLGIDASSSTWNGTGSRGGHSGRFTNGTAAPGARSSAGGGDGITIPGGAITPGSASPSQGGIYGGGGGNVSGSGPGGKGCIYIMWGEGRRFPDKVT